MCGAVSFDATIRKAESHACHCTMCRRWSGSAFIAVEIAEDDVTFQGAENIRTIRSSDWAERGWCDKCGSNLFYRITMVGPMQGTHELALGLFDDPDALPLVSEIYIDRKPGSFAFAGAHKTMTGAEVEAKFAQSPDGANA